MLCLLLVLLTLWWLGLSLFGYTNLLKIFKKYENRLRIPTPDNYNGFLRMDFGKWDQKAMLGRAFTGFPARATSYIGFFTIYATMGLLNKYAKLPVVVL